MTATIVIKGTGSPVRFKTSDSQTGFVRIVTSKGVHRVPLSETSTSVSFHRAA